MNSHELEGDSKMKKNWKSQTLLFLISQCITLFGSTLVQMAIVWYITIQTSSGVWVAAFTVCAYLPQFLISFVQFAAPAAAGALLTVSTLSSTLMIDIITAILGVGLLSTVMIPKQIKSSEKVSLLADMKIGVHYAFSHKLLGKVLTVYGIFIFLCVPAGFLAQLLVSRIYGETYWHLTAVELCGFLGMMFGGLLMSTWGGFKSRVTTMFAGLASFGVLTMGMGLSKHFIFYLVLMLIYGVALTMVQTATTTLIQEKADISMQGRVFGLLGAMYSGFLPIGMAVFGPMADVIPLQWIMIGSGIALVALSLFVQINKNLRLNEK